MADYIPPEEMLPHHVRQRIRGPKNELQIARLVLAFALGGGLIAIWTTRAALAAAIIAVLGYLVAVTAIRMVRCPICHHKNPYLVSIGDHFRVFIDCPTTCQHCGWYAT
jgi:hypothetical protein